MEGLVTLTDPTTWFSGAALLAAVAALVKAGRAVWPYVRALQVFLDDWSGEPARDGVPARPGIMKRLEGVERGVRAAQETAEEAVRQTSGTRLELAALSEQIGVVAHATGQLLPNGGGSLNDAIRDIREDSAKLAGRPAPAPRQRRHTA
jgi:hypothetical protein